MPLPLARTPSEASLYIELHPCACGEAAADVNGGGLLDYAGGLANQRQLTCRGCHQSRQFTFSVPDWPLESPTFCFGDDRPSQLIDPGQWLWVAHVSALDALQQSTSEAERQEGMQYAAAAAAETLKFLPPGTNEIPEHLFLSYLGTNVRKARPTAFRREVLQRHVKLLNGGYPPPAAESVAISWDFHQAWAGDLGRKALLDGLLARIRRYAQGDRSAVLERETLLEIGALLDRNTTFDTLGSYDAALIHWLRYENLPPHEAQDDLAAALRLFSAVKNAPPEFQDPGLVQAIPPAAKLLLG